jgi:hypothetical protein
MNDTKLSVMDNKKNVNPDAFWVPDYSGTLIVLSDAKWLRLSLEGSVVWDLITMYKKSSEVTELVMAVCNKNRREANEMVETYLTEWEAEGLLIQ